MLNDNIIHKEFPQAEGLIYLNHAGVAPWPARARDAVAEFARENVIYGASRYHLFNEKENRLRRQVRELINAPSVDDIALLKNTSEALSVVAAGIRWNRGDNVVTSAEEFPSNWIPWDAQKIHGVSLKKVDITERPSEQALIDACDNRTRLLSVSSVQFSSGIRLDLELLGKFCRTNNILFCVDAIQSIGAHDIDVQEIQADFVMADGHKWMLGPEGIALFYCHEAVREQLNLYQYGWHMTTTPDDFDIRSWQPSSTATRFEPGSSNMLGVYALSASLSLIEDLGMAYIEQELEARVSYLVERLAQNDRISLITPEHPEHRAGIVAFQVSGADQQSLQKRLLEHGVICALRGGAIRFSPHYYNSMPQLDKSLDILQSFI
ncbi:MAG: aminotransferase class V-fold PLP-dependent enzyme [Gammaproteobacteria bacterium]|nr:aminotransferase class V-fold PLP-dependent enzyme [Gammaproteobacteria bacterium]